MQLKILPIFLIAVLLTCGCESYQTKENIEEIKEEISALRKDIESQPTQMVKYLNFTQYRPGRLRCSYPNNNTPYWSWEVNLTSNPTPLESTEINREVIGHRVVYYQDYYDIGIYPTTDFLFVDSLIGNMTHNIAEHKQPYLNTPFEFCRIKTPEYRYSIEVYEIGFEVEHEAGRHVDAYSESCTPATSRPLYMYLEDIHYNNQHAWNELKPCWRIQ